MYTNSGLAISLLLGRSAFVSLCFQSLLELVERLQSPALVLADPALVDLVEGHGIEVVQLLAAAPDRDHEVGVLEQRQMLGHCLTRHVQVLAQLAQGLAVVAVQPIQELPTAWISQCPEDLVRVHARYNRQPTGCLSRSVAARLLVNLELEG